jgi:hypothetical protein
MTKAQILQAVRDIVNEQSTDAGALLDDAANLLGFVDDAIEQVVMDLIPVMPMEFLASEFVSLVAADVDYDLTGEYWRIYKVEKYVAGQNPTEIDILDPLNLQYATQIGESVDEPHSCYIIGKTLYPVPIPAASKTNYFRVWGIRPEATTLPDLGPTYIPRPAHRLIVYWAAGIIATILGGKPESFQKLYQYRLGKVRELYAGKFQQSPKFVRESVAERTTRDEREKVFYDPDWP